MIEIHSFYERGMSAEKLADKVMKYLYEDSEPSFPINPFEIINRFGVMYQFMEFEKLEGIYCLPEDCDDIPIIGINFSRNIQRQRYTAAHELCHHIKDQNSSICPIRGQKNDIEKYAEQFASALLMPKKQLKEQADRYANGGKVDLTGALYISVYFGTSFEATVYALAYRLNMYAGNSDSGEIKRAIRNFHPDRKKAELNLDDDVVAEIIADLRYNGAKSTYCTDECREIVEVLGHSAMYDYIYNTMDKLDIYKIQKLHKMLYQYAPFPEAGGVFRQDNNYVTGAQFETVDCLEVVPQIVALDNPIKELTENLPKLTNAEVILAAAQIHHRLTVIHPFADGNGRCSRAILNWIFRLKGLPPVYIKYPEKEEYYAGLNEADVSGRWDKLFRVFMRETIKSSMQLNKVSVDSYNEV